MPGMILLEPGNRILEDCVRSAIIPEKDPNSGKDKPRIPIDVRLCDFDDVSYHITLDKDKIDVLQVSINIPMYQHTDALGGKAALDKYYGEFKGPAESGFDITLHVKFADIKDPEATIRSLSLLKSRITGGVFEHFFDNLNADKKQEPFKFDLRSDTTVYMCPGDDRVTIVFSVDFKEKVDKVIAKVMLKEFVNTRKSIGRAPPVAWDENPPRELAAFKITENKGSCLGFMSFAILKDHLKTGEKKDVVIAVLQTFRTYLQYHIKMAKSHFHSKMRKRVAELIKVLNRAKVPPVNKDKKLASGKTFKRA